MIQGYSHTAAHVYHRRSPLTNLPTQPFSQLPRERQPRPNQRCYEPQGPVQQQNRVPRLVTPFYLIGTSLVQALYCTNVDAVLRSAKMVVLKPGQRRQPRRSERIAYVSGRFPFHVKQQKTIMERFDYVGKVKHGFLSLYLSQAPILNSPSLHTLPRIHSPKVSLAPAIIML